MKSHLLTWAWFLLLTCYIVGVNARLERLEKAFVTAVYRQVTMTEEQRVRDSVEQYARQYPMSQVGTTTIVRTAQ